MQTSSDFISAPVSLPEFQAATERMGRLFYAMTTDDQPHFGRMMEVWVQGLAERNDASVWAECVETLHSPGMKDQPLFAEMARTLAAIADVYASRLHS